MQFYNKRVELKLDYQDGDVFYNPKEHTTELGDVIGKFDVSIQMRSH